MSARSRTGVPVLFTWITVEGSVDAAGGFDLAERRVLQIDVDGYLALLDAHGAKRTGALVTLAMRSSRHPETGQRVVWGSREEMGALLGGADHGWAAKAVGPLLRSLEAAGLLSYIPAVPLGRGKGSVPPAWILHDGLFSTLDPVVGTPQPAAPQGAAGPSRFGSGHSGSGLAGSGHEGTVPGLEGPGTGVGAGHRPRPVRDGSRAAGQHAMNGMTSSPSHAGSPAGAELVDLAVRGRLIAGLGALGWENPAATVDRHDPALLGAWLERIAARAAAGRPLGGGFLRTQLEDPSGPIPPPGFVPGSRIALDPATGELAITAPAAPAAVREPSTADLAACFDAAGELGAALRAEVAEQVRAVCPAGASPEQRSATWRAAAAEALARHGLLGEQAVS